MPTKQRILDQLKRDELVAAVERLELPVADRRMRDQLIEALADSQEATTAEILGDLKRDRLKELCRELGLDDGGREKAVIIERLAGAGPEAGGELTPPAAREPDDFPRPAAPRPPAAAAPPRPASAAAPPRSTFRSREPDRPRAAPARESAWSRPARSGPPPDRGAGGRRRPPAGRPARRQVNIQDSFLFESLKENRTLAFALSTGQQIQGRIARFDPYTILVDTGKRQILVYKSAISGITAVEPTSRG